MRKVFAKGRMRHVTGQMNKTEAAYYAHLQAQGHAWVEFEAITLKLADGCRYTPDFAVMRQDGVIELHEVKGSKAIFQDDAKVKIKLAAKLFPFVFKLAFPIPIKHGGGWTIEEVNDSHGTETSNP